MKAARKLNYRPKRTRTQRGYDNDWYRFRHGALTEPEMYGLPENFGFCRDCLPVLVPTKDIHHVIPLSVRPDLKFEPSNLMPLCHSCHASRTGREFA